jgi:hypothetical protein
MTQSTNSPKAGTASKKVNPNVRARSAAKRLRRSELFVGKYALATDAVERLAVTFDRVRSGIRHSPADRREQMAEDVDQMLRTFCKANGLP